MRGEKVKKIDFFAILKVLENEQIWDLYFMKYCLQVFKKENRNIQFEVERIYFLLKGKTKSD